MSLKYTIEKNVLILVSLLKEYGIRKVIVSPGTTNFTFVGSLQNDPYFEIYSSVDERSAAYMACGMAAESGEPIVITCTGATASRNYMPALTEAYYRKLPIIAVMAHSGVDCIGNLRPQQIDRRISPTDTYIEKISVVPINNYREEQHSILQINRALLAVSGENKGPVQIELVTNFSTDFSVQALPVIRKITRYTAKDKFPELPNGGYIYIYIGVHKRFTKEEIESLDRFCASRNAIVLCDHTSNYWGNYGFNIGLICSQKNVKSSIRHCNLLIHIGGISGNYYGIDVAPQIVWRVNPDGEAKDFFHRLNSVFAMSEMEFFDKFALEGVEDNSIRHLVKAEMEKIYSLIPELPFSNIWAAQNTIQILPKNSVLHLGILNSLRAWDYFEKDKSIDAYANVGGFGIDGVVSTCLGAAIVNSEKLFFCIVGDLAFFYDLNAVGNRYLPNNLRIMLFNNGSGTEFRNYNHPAHDTFGDDAEPYMAAVGHYGNKSPVLVKHYAEDLGFEYLAASNKNEYLAALPKFVNPEIGEKPILFEVFTDSKDESDALEMMFHLVKPAEPDYSVASKMEQLKNRVKQSVKYRYNNALDKLKL